MVIELSGEKKTTLTKFPPKILLLCREVLVSQCDMDIIRFSTGEYSRSISQYENTINNSLKPGGIMRARAVLQGPTSLILRVLT